MGRLFDQIRDAVAQDRFVVGNHADDRMRERGIELWQLTAELDEAVLVEERPADLPNPTIAVEQNLADGTPVRVVRAWIEHLAIAKLVTVHFIW